MGRFWVNLGPGIEHFFTKYCKNQRFTGIARSGYADFCVRDFCVQKVNTVTIILTCMSVIAQLCNRLDSLAD